VCIESQLGAAAGGKDVDPCPPPQSAASTGVDAPGRLLGRRASRLVSALTSWRVILIASALLFIIPPIAAYGWTRYRYLSDGFDFPNEVGWTSGWLQREYNSAYHQTTEGWEVRYYNTSDQITANAFSWSSPTSLGATTGDRRAWCSFETLTGAWQSGAANCDTTVP